MSLSTAVEYIPKNPHQNNNNKTPTTKWKKKKEEEIQTKTNKKPHRGILE